MRTPRNGTGPLDLTTPAPLEEEQGREWESPPVQRDTDNPATRVMVVAGYPAIRAGLAALLSQQTDFSLTNTIPAPGVDEPSPDVIVADAGSASDDTIDDLAETYPRASFVFVGGDPTVDGPGLESGSVGYLGPEVDATGLALAVRGVAQGLTVIDPALIASSGLHAHAREPAATVAAPGEALTSREREVLELVASGLPNKAIARELGISEHTAKFHVGSLLAKLGAGSRTEAVTLATRRGILSI
jgi:two-component system, NarL family, nitrate/nitrite response regulator NarL